MSGAGEDRRLRIMVEPNPIGRDHGDGLVNTRASVQVVVFAAGMNLSLFLPVDQAAAVAQQLAAAAAAAATPVVKP